jgi:hypothetical protein
MGIVGEISAGTAALLSRPTNEIVELVKDYVHPETEKLTTSINWNSKPMKAAIRKGEIYPEGSGTLGDLYTHPI